MLKKELLKMLENIGDNEKINFISEKLDKAGYPQDKFEPDVYKIVGENYTTKHVGFGVYRIENVENSDKKEEYYEFKKGELKSLIKENGSVVIPDDMTEIPPCAFEKCTSLTSIVIPNGIKSISDYAFMDCTSLTNITIPDSVTTIGNWAFYGCTNLTTVTIGSGVKSIGKAAFAGCSSLTNITIPNSVTSIGMVAFEGCDLLKNKIF